MSRIVAVVNQKGGAGKTALAMNVAGGMAERGYRVVVADADPQGTAQRWAAAASEDAPFPALVVGVAASGRAVHKELEKMVGAYDLIIVDTPPSLEAVAPESALRVADVALIPVDPSPGSLWASAAVFDLVAKVRETGREDLAAYTVANDVERTRMSREAFRALEGMGLPVLDAQLRHLTAYKEAQAWGTTVWGLGTDGAAAAADFGALLDELAPILDLGARHERQKG